MKGLSTNARGVVHISSVHPYTDNRIHYRECKSLVDAGYEVTLVAVESTVVGETTGVRVVTLPRRRRTSRMLLSTFQAVRLAVGTRARVVHLHDPELIPYIPWLRLLQRKVIYDAHEDLPEQVRNKPYLRPALGSLASVFARFLVWVSRSSDAVICATESIAVRYSAEKAVIVHNYPPLRASEGVATSRDVNMRDPSVVYVGGISPLRGALVMIDALDESVMPSGWSMRLAGSVSTSLLEQLQEKRGWGAVTFEGQVPPERARDIILESRVGLVLFADSAAHREALPTKMFEYFAAGVPVIASDFPLWRTIVLEEECGTLVDPTSPAEVAAAVARYANHPELLAAHSRNARRLAVERLNWANEARTLLAVYSRVASS